MLKSKSIFIVIFIALLIFVFLPIKYPVSISYQGKLLPSKIWTLAKGTDGRLITTLSDNTTGISNEFSITQFERGDAVQFKLNLGLISSGNISIGDTIGYVISNEIEKDIQRLKSELETAKASLSVQQSSEKESIVLAEKNRLEFAEKELEEQTKIYDRKKKLFEKDLISQQEFEADEARYELAKINISIAQERLRTVQSGAKEEEIIFANSQIRAIENEINVLQKRFESNIVTSSVNGIINRSFSSDTLIIISDTSKSVVLVPVQWPDSKKVFLGQNVSVYSDDSDITLSANVFSIDNNLRTISNMQYRFTTVVTNEKNIEFLPGLYVNCKFDCGNEKLMNIILDYFKPIIN